MNSGMNSGAASPMWAEARRMVMASPSGSQSAKVDDFHMAKARDELANFASSAVARMAQDKPDSPMRQYFERMDQRQIESFTDHNSANLSGSVAQQFANMQRQIDIIRQNSQQALKKAETAEMQFLETNSCEQRIRVFVRQLFEKVEAGVARVRSDHQEFTHKHEVALVEMQRRMAKEVTQSAAEEIGRKLALCLEREERERKQALENLENSIRSVLEKERNDRDLHNAKVASLVTAAQNDINAIVADMPKLKIKLKMLEEKLQSQAERYVEDLDSHLTSPLERLKEVERRLDKVQASFNVDVLSKVADGVQELIKNERAKMSTFVLEKVEDVKHACQDSNLALRDKLEKERKERQAELEDFRMVQDRYKAALHDRISTVESDSQSCATMVEKVVKEIKDMETHQRRLEDNFVGCIRDTKREILLAIEDETKQRKEADSAMNQQLCWVEEYNSQIQELALQRGRPKMIGLGAASPTARTDGLESVGKSSP